MKFYFVNTATVYVKLSNNIYVYHSRPIINILGKKITGNYHCWIFQLYHSDLDQSFILYKFLLN